MSLLKNKTTERRASSRCMYSRLKGCGSSQGPLRDIIGKLLIIAVSLPA